MNISLPGDLGEFVRQQVESGAYASEEALVAEAVRLLRERTPKPSANGSGAPEGAPRKPIWEVAAEIMADLPPEVLEQLPVDGAEQHDHYIYGTPKRPQ